MSDCITPESSTPDLLRAPRRGKERRSSCVRNLVGLWSRGGATNSCVHHHAQPMLSARMTLSSWGGRQRRNGLRASPGARLIVKDSGKRGPTETQTSRPLRSGTRHTPDILWQLCGPAADHVRKGGVTPGEKVKGGVFCVTRTRKFRCFNVSQCAVSLAATVAFSLQGWAAAARRGM